jgi:hypothetical protein
VTDPSVPVEPTHDQYREQIADALDRYDDEHHTGPLAGYYEGMADQVVAVRDAEMERLWTQLIELRAQRDLWQGLMDDLVARNDSLRDDNTRWMDQNERIASQRDEARRVVAQVNNNHCDFAEALGLDREAYGDEIIAAAKQFRAASAELAELRSRAVVLPEDWYLRMLDVEQEAYYEAQEGVSGPTVEQRAAYRAGSHAAAELLVSWRAAPEPAVRPYDPDEPHPVIDLTDEEAADFDAALRSCREPEPAEATQREWHFCHEAGDHHINDEFHGNDCDRPEHWRQCDHDVLECDECAEVPDA